MFDYGIKFGNNMLKIANIALLTTLITYPILKFQDFKKDVELQKMYYTQEKSNTKSSKLENKSFHEESNKMYANSNCKKCLPVKYGDYIQNQGLKLDNKSEVMDRNFLEKIITVESRWNPNAKSKSNARGLMQIKKVAWKQVEKDLDYTKHVYNPEINLEVGVNYLLWLEDVLEKKHPKWSKLSQESKKELISASFNGGPTELKRKKYQITEMPYETRNYVKKIDKLNF